MIAAIVVVLAGIVILSNGDYNLLSFKGAWGFVKAYGTWAKTIVNNVVDITGYVVSKPWIPQ